MHEQAPKSLTSGFCSNKQDGFTLVELMVTIAVLAIGLTLAVPNFSELINKSRADAHRDRLYTSLMLARSEAAKQGKFVTVCPSSTLTACTASTTDWSDGWIVFVDENGDGSYVASDDDEILRVVEGIDGAMTATWDATDGSETIRFNSQGFLRDSAGEFSICPTDGKDYKKRGIEIGPTGRPHTTKEGDVTC